MAEGYIAPIVPNDIQTPGWNWNPSTAYLNAIQQGEDEAAKTATAARQYQLLPIQLAYEQARAKYYDARADKYEKDINTESPILDLKGAAGSSNAIDEISPDLLKQMNFKSADDMGAGDTGTTASNDSKTPGTTPTDSEMDSAADKSKNPAPPSGSGYGSLTTDDLIHLGIDPNTPLGAIITAPGAPSTGDALATIAQGLPITPENLGANSPARLADQTTSSSGDMPTAASDVGISPVQSAQLAAANAVPDRLQANNPLADFAHGTDQAPKTLGLGGEQILSGSKGVLNIADALKSDASTTPKNDGSIGNKISAYDTAMNQLALRATMAKQDSLRYGALARATSSKDPNRIPLLQKAFNASAESDKYANTGQILALHMTQETGLAPQNIEYLRTLKDPNKINAIHSYVQNGKAPDYASAAQLFTAERNAASKQVDPAAQQALLTKMLGDLKTVTDVKNSGNVTGDNYVKLQAQENALADQINKLTGIQSAQPSQYVDPLDKFNSINTKLSALNASGVKTTDLDLGGGTKLTGVATDPNKSSAIIRPEIMKAAANNNALYDIPHFKLDTNTPEVQRFIQDYNQAPAGKNYVITGLPGMIRKDPSIPAQQVLADHFGVSSTPAKKESEKSSSSTTANSANPLLVDYTKDLSPDNPLKQPTQNANVEAAKQEASAQKAQMDFKTSQAKQMAISNAKAQLAQTQQKLAEIQNYSKSSDAGFGIFSNTFAHNYEALKAQEKQLSDYLASNK